MESLGGYRPGQAWSPGVGAPALACIAGIALTLYLFFPGFMVWDSTLQLEQAVTGRISNPHPPIMAYLWTATNHLVFGPGGMLIVHVCAYWLGITLISTALARSPAGRVATLAGLGLFPPVFGLLPTVIKDVGFLSAMMLLTGCALHLRSRWTLVLGGLGAFYASTVRYNGLPAVLPLLWLMIRVPHPTAATTPRTRVGLAILGTVACTLVATVWLLGNVGVNRSPYRVVVPLWDLAAVSILTGEMLVPDYALRNPEGGIPRLQRTVLPHRANSAALGSNLEPDQVDDLISRWVAAILEHPRAYLRHRTRVTRALFLHPAEPLLHRMQDTKSFELEEHGIRFEPRWGYPTLRRALTRASRTWVHRPWIYLLLATAVWTASFAARRPCGREARHVALSGLLSVAPLPVIAPSTDYRYSIWLVAAAAVATLLFAKRAGISPAGVRSKGQAAPESGLRSSRIRRRG